MKCFLPNFPSEKAAELMRWFGYVPHREDEFVSFVRSPFAPEARFPRFHALVFSKSDGLQVNLHLDQEDGSRQGNHQFVWAYHNPLVMEEGQRLNFILDRARERLLKMPSVFILPSKPVVRQIKIDKTRKIITFLARQKILCRFF